MCISLLQLHQKHKVNENANLGVLLVEFFDLYGRKFDYNGTCISILNDGQYFPKRNLPSFKSVDKKPMDLLCIEDPLKSGINVRSSPYGISKVKNIFEFAYNKLRTVMSSTDENASAKKCKQQCILNSVVHITDDIIINRNFFRDNFEHTIVSSETLTRIK